MLNLKKGGVSEEVLGRGVVVSDFLFLSREKTNFILNCYKSKRLVFILRTLEKEREDVEAKFRCLACGCDSQPVSLCGTERGVQVCSVSTFVPQQETR